MYSTKPVRQAPEARHTKQQPPAVKGGKTPQASRGHSLTAARGSARSQGADSVPGRARRQGAGLGASQTTRGGPPCYPAATRHTRHGPSASNDRTGACTGEG